MALQVSKPSYNLERRLLLALNLSLSSCSSLHHAHTQTDTQPYTSLVQVHLGHNNHRNKLHPNFCKVKLLRLAGESIKKYRNKEVSKQATEESRHTGPYVN